MHKLSNYLYKIKQIDALVVHVDKSQTEKPRVIFNFPTELIVIDIINVPSRQLELRPQIA